MNRNEIFNKVAELITAQLPVSIDKVQMDSRLVEDLGADSANVMILVFDLEREFNVEVDNDMLATVETVKDIVDYLEKNA
ncbi:MAG: acyl carrier protein [Clostridia bacterium]|nr:acyl carrier protein [Clostridia bacterium]MBQ3232695.1 acyl carrier protein [Clostridia bacterium]MBQ4618606.1 acyl carrier protein [Clostridia bacterium]MBQ9856532.1 acyl carrier protein [Clostridia bacterium]